MTYKLYMPKCGEEGVMIVISDSGEKVEFRGTPYSKWKEGESSDFYKIHSVIKRVDISRLHSSEVEVCTSWHGPEYEIIKCAFIAAQKFITE